MLTESWFIKKNRKEKQKQNEATRLFAVIGQRPNIDKSYRHTQVAATRGKPQLMLVTEAPSFRRLRGFEAPSNAGQKMRGTPGGDGAVLNSLSPRVGGFQSSIYPVIVPCHRKPDCTKALLMSTIMIALLSIALYL